MYRLHPIASQHGVFLSDLDFVTVSTHCGICPFITVQNIRQSRCNDNESVVRITKPFGFLSVDFARLNTGCTWRLELSEST